MLNNLFTGTENLFKLLFINGLVIILIGLFYPLQKRDELELKIIEYNSNVNLLNRDIKELYDESYVLKIKIKKVKSKKPHQNEQNQLQTIYNELKRKIYEQDKKVIEIENQQKRIKTLQSQQETYNNYCDAFLIFGGLITITGLLGWSRLTYFMYDKEYSDFKQRNIQSQDSQNISRFFPKGYVIIAILLILVLITISYYIIY